MPFVAIMSETEAKKKPITPIFVGGRPLAIYNVDDKLYATHRLCSHTCAPLTRGKLEGHVIECPLHKAKFDVRDGSVVNWASRPAAMVKVLNFFSRPRPVKSYPLKVENGKVLIDLP